MLIEVMVTEQQEQIQDLMTEQEQRLSSISDSTAGGKQRFLHAY